MSTYTTSMTYIKNCDCTVSIQSANSMAYALINLRPKFALITQWKFSLGGDFWKFRQSTS